MKNIALLNVVALGLSLCVLHPIQAVTPPPDGGYPNANTAEGDQALFSLTTGADNTAIGFNTLFSNTTGSSNTAIGVYSLANNTNGSFNTAYGQFALQSNGTGTDNMAVGYNALFNNTTGNSNVAVGASAGINLTTGSANIDLGNPGVAGESKTVRIGTAGTQTATFIAGITGTPVTGVAVGITADGQLGVRGSSVRFKEAIKPMDKQSEAILALRPVSFRYKKELDPKGTPQFGLVAEQVAQVDPDLVARDVDGKPYTVRYEEVNAMLLNEFLKEHRKVETLEATVAAQQNGFESQQKQAQATAAQQQKEINALIATLKEQASQIQKVSNEIELIKPRPRVVINEP